MKYGEELQELRLLLARVQSESCSIVSDSLSPHGLSSPWSSPGQNTGVGSLSLLQGIFPTQELDWGLLHCRQILYQLSYQGSQECREGLPLYQHRKRKPGTWFFSSLQKICTVPSYKIRGQSHGGQAALSLRGLRKMKDYDMK